MRRQRRRPKLHGYQCVIRRQRLCILDVDAGLACRPRALPDDVAVVITVADRVLVAHECVDARLRDCFVGDPVVEMRHERALADDRNFLRNGDLPRQIPIRLGIEAGMVARVFDHGAEARSPGVVDGCDALVTRPPHRGRPRYAIPMRERRAQGFPRCSGALFLRAHDLLRKASCRPHQSPFVSLRSSPALCERHVCISL